MRCPEYSFRNLVATLSLLVLTACATEIVREPVSFSTQAASAQSDYVVDAPIAVSSTSGYERRVPAGSRWRLVGTIPQGDVYRRVDDVFSIEGAHMHEAFLVVAQGQLVGFYLPVEKSYSPARSAVPIAVQRKQQ
jgi:hypothetical protein